MDATVCSCALPSPQAQMEAGHVADLGRQASDSVATQVQPFELLHGRNARRRRSEALAREVQGEQVGARSGRVGGVAYRPACTDLPIQRPNDPTFIRSCAL